MWSNEDCARRILEVIPLVMRNVGAELRQEAAAGFSVPHYHVLARLSHGTRNLSELAQCQAVAPPTMSRTVSALVERGWLTRSQDPRDRRCVIISLTDEGRAYFESLHTRAEEYMVGLVASLSAEQREVLLTGLEILRSLFEGGDEHESH